MPSKQLPSKQWTRQESLLHGSSSQHMVNLALARCGRHTDSQRRNAGGVQDVQNPERGLITLTWNEGLCSGLLRPIACCGLCSRCSTFSAGEVSQASSASRHVLPSQQACSHLMPCPPPFQPPCWMLHFYHDTHRHEPWSPCLDTIPWYSSYSWFAFWLDVPHMRVSCMFR